MRSLLSSIILFGFFIQTYFNYAGAKVPTTGINVQTNLCTSTWINTVAGNDIQNESRINGAFEINRPCNSVTRNTPLHLALIGGADLDKVKAFVESGANVLARNADDEDALLLAKRHSSVDVYSYVWRVVTETEEFKAVALREFVDRFTEEQASLITAEDSDADQEADNTQESSGYYNHSLVSRVTSDYYREAYDDYVQELRRAFHEYYSNRRYQEINVEYYQDTLRQWSQREEEWYNYSDDVEETFEAYKERERSIPVGIYVAGDFRLVLKSLFTQEHSVSSGERWSTDFETQVGLGGGLTAGYAFAMPDNESFRVRLEGAYTRRQIAGNKDHTSDVHQSFADLNMNQYEGNLLFDFPRVFDSADNWLRDVTFSTGFGIINVDPNLAYTVSLEGSGNPPNTFHLEGDNSRGFQWILAANRRLTNWINVGIEANFMKFWEGFTSSDHRWTDIRNQMQTYNARINSMSGVDVSVKGTIYLNRINSWLRNRD